MAPMVAGNLGESFYQGPMVQGMRFGRDDEEKLKPAEKSLIQGVQSETVIPSQDEEKESPVAPSELPEEILDRISVTPKLPVKEDKPRVARFLMTEDEEASNALDAKESSE